MTQPPDDQPPSDQPPGPGAQEARDASPDSRPNDPTGPTFARPAAGAGLPAAGGPTFVAQPGGGPPTGPVPPAGAPPAMPNGGTYELASWGSRVGAYLIDALILIVLICVYVVLGALAVGGIDAATRGSDAGGDLTAAAIVLLVVGLLALLVLLLAYAPFFMSRWNGATPGKRAVGIRVIREDGLPMTLGFAAFREIVVKQLLGQIASAVTCGIAPILDVLWPLWDDGNRALHDMVAKSRVIRA